MPRDASGNYTLPAGNPVVGGTIIESNWANPTMSDIANEVTDSLSRSGQGGMLAPLKNVDGTALLPSITFLNDVQSGMHLANPSEIILSVAGVNNMRWNTAGSQVWDGAAWQQVATSASVAGDFLALNGTNFPSPWLRYSETWASMGNTSRLTIYPSDTSGAPTSSANMYLELDGTSDEGAFGVQAGQGRPPFFVAEPGNIQGAQQTGAPYLNISPDGLMLQYEDVVTMFDVGESSLVYNGPLGDNRLTVSASQFLYRSNDTSGIYWGEPGVFRVNMNSATDTIILHDTSKMDMHCRVPGGNFDISATDTGGVERLQVTCDPDDRVGLCYEGVETLQTAPATAGGAQALNTATGTGVFERVLTISDIGTPGNVDTVEFDTGVTTQVDISTAALGRNIVAFGTSGGTNYRFGTTLPIGFYVTITNTSSVDVTMVALSNVILLPPAGGSLVVPSGGYVTVARVRTDGPNAIFQVYGLTT